MKYNSVLVYVDEREESSMALEHAAMLCKATGARAAFMDVLEAMNSLDDWPGAADDLLSVRKMIARDREHSLVARAARHGFRAPPVLVTFGKTSVELIRTVLAQGHDLLIKTSRGRQDGRRISFGSAAMHLVRKCPCPVLLVAPTATALPKRIMVAVNPVGPLRLGFATRVLREGLRFSRLFDAEMHLVHAWSPRAESLLRGKVDAETLSEYVEGTRMGAQSGLAQLQNLAGITIPESRIHLVRGDAAETLARVTRDERADLLVMGSVGTSVASGQLVGTTAEETLVNVDCSVLSIKPEGFVSPIQRV
jgi:nucleotide-binding universal stress UspA family protein